MLLGHFIHLRDGDTNALTGFIFRARYQRGGEIAFAVYTASSGGRVIERAKKNFFLVGKFLNIYFSFHIG